MWAHEQSLSIADLHRAIAWEKLEAGAICFVGCRPRCPRLDPIDEHLMITRAGGKALPAFMWYLTGRLENHQAFVGKSVIDAARVDLAREPIVIPIGSKGAERKFESVLA